MTLNIKSAKMEDDLKERKIVKRTTGAKGWYFLAAFLQVYKMFITYILKDSYKSLSNLLKVSYKSIKNLWKVSS